MSPETAFLLRPWSESIVTITFSLAVISISRRSVKVVQISLFFGYIFTGCAKRQFPNFGYNSDNALGPEIPFSYQKKTFRHSKYVFSCFPNLQSVVFIIYRVEVWLFSWKRSVAVNTTISIGLALPFSLRRNMQIETGIEVNSEAYFIYLFINHTVRTVNKK